MALTTFSGPVASTNGFITGTSTSPLTITTAGNVDSSYVTTTAASGDSRLTYQKMTFNGAGAGETSRVFTVVTAAQGAGQTTNGSHISNEINTGGTISGAANAIRATLGGTATSPGGTLAVLQLDTNFASGVSLPASASFIRVTDSGTAGKITSLMNLPSAMVVAKTAAAVTHTIKVMVGGTAYYLMVSNAQ
jgi:hypothetical protein